MSRDIFCTKFQSLEKAIYGKMKITMSNGGRGYGIMSQKVTWEGVQNNPKLLHICSEIDTIW